MPGRLCGNHMFRKSEDETGVPCHAQEPMDCLVLSGSLSTKLEHHLGTLASLGNYESKCS